MHRWLLVLALLAACASTPPTSSPSPSSTALSSPSSPAPPPAPPLPTPPPSPTAGVDGSVDDRLAPEIIQPIVRAHFDAFRECYRAGVRRRNATLEGVVTVRFVVDRTGVVTDARDEGSTLPDAEVVKCVVRGFRKLTFPSPDGAPVTVVYPIQFNPWD